MTVARRVGYALAGLLFSGLLVTGVILWHSGYRAYIVHTGSMNPAYVSGDLVIDGPPSSHLRPGEVITFRHSDLTTDVVTHRVTDIRDGVIHTKGDANPTDDAWAIRPDQVRGVVATRIPRLGYLVVFLEQPAGVGSVVTGAVALIVCGACSSRPDH
jgi:signal peptidase